MARSVTSAQTAVVQCYIDRLTVEMTVRWQSQRMSALLPPSPSAPASQRFKLHSGGLAGAIAAVMCLAAVGYIYNGELVAQLGMNGRAAQLEAEHVRLDRDAPAAALLQTGSRDRTDAVSPCPQPNYTLAAAALPASDAGACSFRLDRLLSARRAAEAVRGGTTDGGPEAGPAGAVACPSLAGVAEASTVEQLWRWRGRGLYAVPAGSGTASLVNDTVSHFLSHPQFDVVIFAFDSHDWSDTRAYPWIALGEPRVRVIRAKGQKHVLAKQHLPASALAAAGYSHLFLWDDDIELLRTFHAGDVLQTLQMVPRIKVAAPYVVGGCHLACWVSDVPLPAGHDVTTTATPQTRAHFLVSTPETMLPIYGVDSWACYSDLVDPAYPESWGMDSCVSGCLCSDVGAALHELGQVILLQAGVNHADRHSLTGSSSFNLERARAGADKLVAAARSTPRGRECVDTSNPVRFAGELSNAALGACIVPS